MKLSSIIILAAIFAFSCNNSSNKTAEKEMALDSSQVHLISKENYEKEWENPKRFISLEGAANFRDLGGYGTANGEQVSWSKLYRSDKLSALTENDLKTVSSLGIKTVVDLRSEIEKQRDPSILPEGINIVEIPIWRKEWNYFLELSAEGIDSLERATKQNKNEQSIAESYMAFPVEFKNEIGKFFKVLSQENNYPLLFHCSAGTDRTGFLSALTLSLLEVPEETIVEDYALSKKLRLNATEKDTRIVYSLEKIKEYGGIWSYLTSINGKNEAELKRIQSILIK